ncbi:hypothetical protein BJI67_16290 (plasmid) [Acidihalobacter aeolianus]|uniref:Uncharacterized protein n=1 Tax=Acidihalobacter aeolianus TaxID=2792603 RepID=A0A1D8KCW0_9GAMM|nr:hypothetical protein [Acidihalobacter aeolianus]AOV18797.1 hypothetical protein BJI67_16290 [Acidihalobacter aeolianus]
MAASLNKVLCTGREVMSNSDPDAQLSMEARIRQMMASYHCSYDRTAAIVAELHDTLLPVVGPAAAEQLQAILYAISHCL